MMRTCFLVLFFISLAGASPCIAQKPFTEGTILYKVKLETTGHKAFSGIYTFTFKGQQVKKELKLSNGYQDIVLYNCSANTIYSLQNRNGKKYAIQLSMAEYQKGQEKFAVYSMKNETAYGKKIAGCTALKGDVGYNDGTTANITYTKEWYPSQSITFERFPDAKFFPLIFSYTDAQGMAMEFEAAKFAPAPVEDAVFRIPLEYQIISYAEYKELIK
jgi:hypothetical protein